MTPLKPFLRLSRLVVFKAGKAVYDETFHAGVNVIRGWNSSGKSSIADFIHFALGGDVVKWKQVAGACDYVVAGINVSGQEIAVRRKITESRSQPMEVFWGDVAKSLNSSVEGWEIYPFKRSENKESFSQVLFRAIGLPELRSDTDSNITMHQILRLIFVDQLTPPDALMSHEAFDSPFVRQAVGDYLIGTFDDVLYRDQMKLRDALKASDDLKTRISALMDAFGDLEQESDLSIIENAVAEKQEQLTKIAAAITAAKNLSEPEVAELDQTVELQKAYNRLRIERASLLEQIDSLSAEINDSKEFIDELASRAVAIEESLQIREALGSIEVQVCPNCLQRLNSQHGDENCKLCGQTWPETHSGGQRLRMQQELALQIKESGKLMEDKENRLNELKAVLPTVQNEIKKAHLRLSEALSKTKTKRDSELDQYFEKRGTLESEISYLLKFQRSASAFAELQHASAKRAAEIRELQMSIEKKKRELFSRGEKGSEAISRIASEFLRGDIPSEEVFVRADKVSVDFSKNTFSVDGLNQFSASSMTLLKNSVHFAFLFASLDLDFFRYPRLIICDNMEDKGMVPERSKNFQRMVAERSNTARFEHQIIFTTSMIDSTLENPEICIGDKYDHGHKSLKV